MENRRRGEWARHGPDAGRGSCGIGMSLASFLGFWGSGVLGFWAVAARRNSSLAPHGPRSLSLPSPRIRLRWAKSISTFFGSLQEIASSSVLPISRANCRAPSISDRATRRGTPFGRHFIFREQTSRSAFRALYLADVVSFGPLRSHRYVRQPWRSSFPAGQVYVSVLLSYRTSSREDVPPVRLVLSPLGDASIVCRRFLEKVE